MGLCDVRKDVGVVSVVRRETVVRGLLDDAVYFLDLCELHAVVVDRLANQEV